MGKRGRVWTKVALVTFEPIHEGKRVGIHADSRVKSIRGRRNSKGKGPETYLTRLRTHAEAIVQGGNEQNVDRGSKGERMSHGGGSE